MAISKTIIVDDQLTFTAHHDEANRMYVFRLIDNQGDVVDLVELSEREMGRLYANGGQGQVDRIFLQMVDKYRSSLTARTDYLSEAI